MNIQSLTGWIFDMDGTLTVPIHDFAMIRRELGMVAGQEDILGWIESLDPDTRLKKEEILEAIELDLAHRTVAQQGIHDILELLKSRGCKLGVITRNNLLNTRITLEAAGLASFFELDSIRTRECAAAKPDPEAIFQLLELWNIDREKAVICGDFKHDLNAGRNAGISTIYFNSRPDDQWKVLADLSVDSWREVIDLL